jgi:hypothetical protein
MKSHDEQTNVTAESVDEVDPTKPRPGEPGYTLYEPWEDPAFQWFRDLNKEARDRAELIARLAESLTGQPNREGEGS